FYEWLDIERNAEETVLDLRNTLKRGDSWRGVLTLSHAGGAQPTVVDAVLRPTHGGHAASIVGVMFDISRRYQVEESLRLQMRDLQARLSDLQENAEQRERAHIELLGAQSRLQFWQSAVNNAVHISETDPEGVITSVNEAFLEIT